MQRPVVQRPVGVRIMTDYGTPFLGIARRRAIWSNGHRRFATELERSGAMDFGSSGSKKLMKVAVCCIAARGASTFAIRPVWPWKRAQRRQSARFKLVLVHSTLELSPRDMRPLGGRRVRDFGFCFELGMGQAGESMFAQSVANVCRLSSLNDQHAIEVLRRRPSDACLALPPAELSLFWFAKGAERSERHRRTFRQLYVSGKSGSPFSCGHRDRGNGCRADAHYTVRLLEPSVVGERLQNAITNYNECIEHGRIDPRPYRTLSRSRITRNVFNLMAEVAIQAWPYSSTRREHRPHRTQFRVLLCVSFSLTRAIWPMPEWPIPPP